MPSDFNVDRYFPTEKIGDYQPGQDAPGSPQAAPGGQEGGGLGSAVKVMTTYLGNLSKRQQQADMEAQTTVQTNSSTGMTQLTIPTPLFMENAEKSKAFDHIQNMYNQDIARIEAERAQRAKRPWASALATIAGSLAANDPNPTTRGLGQAALRLNPTDQELRERELPILEAAGRLEGQRETRLSREEATRARLSQEKESLAERTRHAKETEATAAGTLTQKKVEKALQSARLIVQKGGGKPMSEQAFAAHMRANNITDPQAIKDAYIDHQEQALLIKSGLDVAQEGKKELIQARGAEQRQNQIAAYALKKDYNLFTREGQKEFAQFKQNLKQDEGLRLVTPKNKDNLGGLLATEHFIGRVEAILSKPEYAQMMGFRSVAMSQVPKFLKAADRVELENLLAHETPRILELVLGTGHGGASLLRTEAGREMIRQLGVTPDTTVEQAARVLKNIQGTISEKRVSIATESPLTRWNDYKMLLGKDANTISKMFSDQGSASTGDPLEDILRKYAQPK